MMTAEATADPERGTMPKVVRTADEKRLDKNEQERLRRAALTPARKEEERAKQKVRTAGYSEVLKDLKAACVRIEPPIAGCRTPAALAGHFAGDGCASPERMSISSATADVVYAAKDVWGGSVCRAHARGHQYQWRLSYGSARQVVEEALLPYAWGKQQQLREWLDDRNPDVMSALKLVPPVIDMGPAIRDGVIDQIVGGFLGSDGSVGTVGYKNTFRPRVEFSQKFREILDVIHSNFPGSGGGVKAAQSTLNGKTHDSFVLVYTNVAAMDFIRRVEPYVTTSYKRSICHAILNMPKADIELQKTVWGLKMSYKDLPPAK
jgi:hypothetical protein